MEVCFVESNTDKELKTQISPGVDGNTKPGNQKTFQMDIQV